jgi:hypothetical protein
MTLLGVATKKDEWRSVVPLVLILFIKLTMGFAAPKAQQTPKSV